MAITVKRNKEGKFDTTYSGFDRVQHEFGNQLENIKSVAKTAGSVAKKAAKAVAGAPKAYVKAVGAANARKAKADASRELDEITRAFGSVENYEKLYPETKKRHDQLRKTAGY